MSNPPNLEPSVSTRKKAVLLPDHVFFVRVVPLAAGGLPADVPAQVELVLDGLTPFSVAQLCYGYFTRPGAGRAVVYAAYRRRFTVEDAKTWIEADVVLPAFATCFGLAPTRPETLLLSGPDFITAIAWDGRNAVPAVVRTRAVEAEATAAERSEIEAELAAQMQEFPAPVKVAAPKESASRIGDSGLEFLVGDQISRFDSAQLDAVDVRDKAELSARRRARARDNFLWKAFVGSAVAIVAAAFLQLGLLGGRIWLKSQTLRTAAQAPAVQKIETGQNLANRIDELSTRRLMPIRMLEIANERRLSSAKSIQFLRTTTKGLYGLEIEGQTSVTADVFNYQAALKALPACESVDLGQTTDRGGVTHFILTIKFKPEALRPETPS